ncbi:MAG: endonuclease MutS2 [Dehalococcoidia bacterium]
MDEKSLEMLEFPKVREIVAGFTSFSASRHLALNLKPSSNPELISHLLRQSAEARRFLSLEPDFSIRGALDVRDTVHMAARGKVLEPQALVDIQMTLVACRHVRADLRREATELPLLWDIVDRIVELPHLEKDIGRCFTVRGELLDSASAKLADLRHRLKETRQRLLDCLEGIIRSDGGRRFAQAAFIDEREGRYVIPVRVELRKEIEGIVHDVSNTGATVFVEPLATVELGNDLRQLVIEEKREVERILSALSSEVGANEAELSQNVGLVAELDLALAKARYAGEAKAAEPSIVTAGDDGQGLGSAGRGVLRLVNARHPLLKGKAVPLSVEIGSDYSILVITGPNTGGKTVALKTIGLLTLMTQAGMPIPASEESCIPIFDAVFVDIGDEQSIEHTLSTFSWHMGNIVRIIRDSTERSLVLLDELGTSTDPNEGAALARAILLHFLSMGAMVVATTHYSDLKVFAHTNAGLQNASLDFDPVTLSPTYHLTIGIPGGSNALAIASQLGLSSEIIDSARGMLAKGDQDMEVLLADLVSEKQKVEALRNSLEEEEGETQKLKSYLENELQMLKEREQDILREARDRVARETAQLQRQIHDAKSELKKAKSAEKIEQARKTLNVVREQLASQTWQTGAGRGDMAPESSDVREIAVGDEVWLSDIELWATVLALPEGDGLLEVQAGRTRLRLNVGDIEKARPGPGETLPEYPVVKKRLSRRAISLELDLRGKRADEVEPELDSYLNDASLAGLGQVRIIHGFGTGVVRQIVRGLLVSHSLVKSFRPGEQGEGGDGVTLAEL